MSNEPENRYQDQGVTEAYRALANERAPDHLTEHVLKIAADVRTPYARARAWMRPAAWAATVGLSLAIVLQLTQFPPSDTDYIGIAPTTDSDTRDNRASRYDDAVPPSRGQVAEPSTPVSKKEEFKADETMREPVAAEAPRSIEVPTTRDFAPRAESVMQEAEALSRARTGSDKDYAEVPAETDTLPAESRLIEEMSTDLAAQQHEAAGRQKATEVAEEARSTAAPFAAMSTAATVERACAEAERETADAWLACIQQLRKDGQDEQADEEYEEFRQVYPDFDESVIDK